MVRTCIKNGNNKSCDQGVFIWNLHNSYIFRACLEVNYFLSFWILLWYFFSNTVFGRILKNYVFKTAVLVMQQYFHSFGNLALDQSFQYRGKKIVCMSWHFKTIVFQNCSFQILYFQIGPYCTLNVKSILQCGTKNVAYGNIR